MKSSFNKPQSEAITHGKGPALILAGPGSGKTLVITQRVKNLIEKQHIRPSNILVITFTKAAATQMKERFTILMGEGRYPVTFGTFHAVFFSVLKNAYHYTAQNIIREEKKYQILYDIIHRMELEYEDEQEFMSGVLSEISLVKNEGIDLSHYYAKTVRQIFSERFISSMRQVNREQDSSISMICLSILMNCSVKERIF